MAKGEITMCGIAGIISPNGMDVAAKLLEMLSLIQHRGPDASGIAVYGGENEIRLRASITKKEMYPVLLKLVGEYGVVRSEQTTGGERPVTFTELTLEIAEADIAQLHMAVNRTDGLYIHSLGRGMRVYKDGGLIDRLIAGHKIAHPRATHGMGHVRMATESAEDINAAHPFTSPFFSDLTIVHNGQFTNYFNLRRYLESKGAIFKTLNDSEAASHFIAYAMRQNGGDLEGALHQALEELDGIYCIIAATADQIGFVKDRMGIKPLLLFEQDGLTLFGSEQIEFTALFPDVFAAEMEPGEVRVWNL
jgi:glutamine phosphoribosylpyrophosphate amidotransferase